MTIRQQGGVFGRNPTFNDVETNDLTVEGQLLQTGSENVGIGTASPNGSGTRKTVHIDGANGAAVRLSDASNSALLRYNTLGSLDLMTVGSVPLGLYTTNVERLNIAASGDVTVKTGNLVIGTSGNGIDFSATSGTGTSELFDDYEEGTWTPAFDTTNGDLDVGSGTISTSLAKYTKIGNRVFLEARFSVASPFTSVGTGDVIITGLPFASSSSGGVDSSVKIGYAFRFATAAPISGYTTGSEIRLLTTAYTTASAFTAMPAANLNITGSNKNVIALSVNYEAV
jgi:hypothetical protein